MKTLHAEVRGPGGWSLRRPGGKAGAVHPWRSLAPDRADGKQAIFGGKWGTGAAGRLRRTNARLAGMFCSYRSLARVACLSPLIPYIVSSRISAAPACATSLRATASWLRLASRATTLATEHIRHLGASSRCAGPGGGPQTEVSRGCARPATRPPLPARKPENTLGRIAPAGERRWGHVQALVAHRLLRLSGVHRGKPRRHAQQPSVHFHNGVGGAGGAQAGLSPQVTHTPQPAPPSASSSCSRSRRFTRVLSNLRAAERSSVPPPAAFDLAPAPSPTPLPPCRLPHAARPSPRAPAHPHMDTSYRTMEALAPACCAPPSPDRSSPEASAAFAPRATPAPDAPAACSGISDGQLLALTDTASLTADQLDRRHHLLRHRCAAGVGRASLHLRAAVGWLPCLHAPWQHDVLAAARRTCTAPTCPFPSTLADCSAPSRPPSFTLQPTGRGARRGRPVAL